MKCPFRALCLLLFLTASISAWSAEGASDHPVLEPAEDQDRAVIELRGGRFAIPAECLPQRRLGGAVAERTVRSDEQTRRLDAQETQRRLGTSEAQRRRGGDQTERRMGADEAGRQLAARDAQRKPGKDSATRNLGAGESGRSTGSDLASRRAGSDTAERSLGGQSSNRQLGGGEERRETGGAVAERNLGGDVSAYTCRLDEDQITVRIFNTQSARPRIPEDSRLQDLRRPAANQISVRVGS